MDTRSSTLIKISVAFEPDDHDWVQERARDLYGRRGIAMYIRKLVREDRDQVGLNLERERLEEETANESHAARVAAAHLGHGAEEPV